MIVRREELDELLSNTIFDIFHWVKLLNFYERYKDDLSIDDLCLIVTRSEIHRNEFNKTNRDQILKQDVSPNLYLHLERLEYKNNNIPAKDSGRDADSIGEISVLAI